jgi:chorismate mutase
MDPLSHLRGMIAALDEELVDGLCARAGLHLNEQFYAAPRTAVPSLDVLAGDFAAAATLAGRVHLLRPAYLEILLPSLCLPGNAGDRNACLAADTTGLDALARRLALSVHVATRKREAIPDALKAAIHTGNPARVEDAITNPAVEAEVLSRVCARARQRAPRPETPAQVAALYANWIIPLSRKIQVHGLLAAP